MKLTPGQVQEILQLSPATFRHWKKALPPLGGRKGYTPCFSPGDLLAMALVKTLTEDVGLRVGSLRGLAVEIFNQCEKSWAGLERSVLIVEPLRQAVISAPEKQPIASDGVMIVIPIRPLIVALRARLLPEQAEIPQQQLRFPPAAVAGTRNRVDAS